MARLVEDRALLEAFRRGERAALAEVYREYAPPLHAFFATGFTIESAGKAFLFKGFPGRWAADDAVQEVFVRAFSPAARLAYDGLRPYRNLLFTMGRNFVIDRWRVRCREVDLGEDDSLEAPGAEAGPAELAGACELEVRCAAFVEGLDADERALFEARFQQGLSIEETARRLGISEHRAKRGEQKLKKRFFLRLREDGYFEGYRYGRAGIERLGNLLLLLLVGAGR